MPFETLFLKYTAAFTALPMRSSFACGKCFTGTSLCVDTATGHYSVLLTNRVHPTRANKNLQSIRLQLRSILYPAP